MMVTLTPKIRALAALGLSMLRKIYQPLWRAVNQWIAADGMRMSAAMSFYGILSLAPLLVLLLWAAAAVGEGVRAVRLDDPDALAAAVDQLLTRKPHLAARRPAGDIGQGNRGSAPAPFSLLGLLKERT